MSHLFTVRPRKLLCYKPVVYQHLGTKLPLCPPPLFQTWHLSSFKFEMFQQSLLQWAKPEVKRGLVFESQTSGYNAEVYSKYFFSTL